MNCSNTPKIVLASSSRYRASLLKKLQLPFEQASPDINESVHPREKAPEAAKRLAYEKALTLATSFNNHLIIGSDQIATVNNERTSNKEILLGKPLTKENAIKQLQLCNGSQVCFYTSLCVLNSKNGAFHVENDITKVNFKTLTDQQIKGYIEKEMPLDCAGSFKSESLGIALFDSIETTDPNALVGLPLLLLTKMLEKEKVDLLAS